jgi:uncharacterized protein YcfJ
MRHFRAVAVSLSALVALAGCATQPMGPKVQVMPAANKPFEVFQQDQATCKQYAADQVGGQADSANEKAIGTAVIGTALGAGLGAAVGGGHGAGVGAASGGILGTAVGAGNSQRDQRSIQQQYDNAYAQCMYAKGNQVVPPAVPVVVQPTVVYPAPAVIYTQPPAVYAPPPAGYAPPSAGYAPPSEGTTVAPPPPGMPAPQ